MSTTTRRWVAAATGVFLSMVALVGASSVAGAAALPTVTSVSPVAGATDISTSTTVTATLSGLPDAGLPPVLGLSSPGGVIVGTSSFATGSRVVTFTPAAALPTSVVISAVVTVGAAALEGGRWTFTTTAAPAPVGTCPCSLWTDADRPAVANWADPNAVQVGVRFRASAAGTLSGVRFYKGPTNTGTHTVRLWNASGTLLATAPQSVETPSGWQTVRFAQPVAVVAGQTYTAGYHSTSGRYSVTSGGLAGARTRGPLSTLANGGAYVYGTGFPATASSTNYWVDVIFTPTASAGAPNITSLTSDKATYAHDTAATFTAAGTNLTGGAWAWSVTRNGAPFALPTSPAAGPVLTVTLGSSGAYRVTATVTNNGLTSTRSLDVTVEEDCALTEQTGMIDMMNTKVGSFSFTVGVNCVGEKLMTIQVPGWLTAPATVTGLPGATVRVPMEYKNWPESDFNEERIGVWVGPKVGSPVLMTPIAYNTPPNITGATCSPDAATGRVHFVVTADDREGLPLEVRVLVGGRLGSVTLDHGTSSAGPREAWVAAADLAGSFWGVLAIDSGGQTRTQVGIPRGNCW